MPAKTVLGFLFGPGYVPFSLSGESLRSLKFLAAEFLQLLSKLSPPPTTTAISLTEMPPGIFKKFKFSFLAQCPIWGVLYLCYLTFADPPSSFKMRLKSLVKISTPLSICVLTMFSILEELRDLETAELNYCKSCLINSTSC